MIMDDAIGSKLFLVFFYVTLGQNRVIFRVTIRLYILIIFGYNIVPISSLDHWNIGLNQPRDNLIRQNNGKNNGRFVITANILDSTKISTHSLGLKS
jgi:hypothetical protein